MKKFKYLGITTYGITKYHIWSNFIHVDSTYKALKNPLKDGEVQPVEKFTPFQLIQPWSFHVKARLKRIQYEQR